MNIRERLLEAYPDEEFLFADGYDEAIIGVQPDLFGQNDGHPRLIYSVKKVLALYIATCGGAYVGSPTPVWKEAEGSYEEAREFFDFNIAGAYAGKQTPIWCEDELFNVG
jgi:hypothetical protein